mgnify:CR=1 FL=1
MFGRLALQVGVLSRRRTLERRCGWTAAQLAEHQAAEVARIRTFAVARSPFYARFHRGLDGRPLDALPVLTKGDLMAHFDDLVTDRTLHLDDLEAFLVQAGPDARYRRRYTVLATSGSTGRRGLFVFDRDEWMTAVALISRPMSWAGIRPHLFPRWRTAMIASTSTSHYSAQVGRAIASPLLPTLRLGADEPAARLVARLNAWQPHVLVAYPSVLRQLADEQQAGRLRIAPRACATSAEVLTAETRQRVADAFGIRVFETYGATEYTQNVCQAPRDGEPRYGSVGLRMPYTSVKTVVLGRHQLSARDAIHAAVMMQHQIPQIMSFDAGFDGLLGLGERAGLEPFEVSDLLGEVLHLGHRVHRVDQRNIPSL